MKKNSPFIRDYRDEDFQDVLQLWIDTGIGDHGRGDNSTTIRTTLDMGGRLLVLEDPVSNSIIGTSWLTQDGRRIYLHHFGITPGQQGKGFSKILLRASLDHARTSGMQIKLEVHRTNEISEKIYTRSGFKYLGDYKIFIIRDYQSIELK